MTSQSHRRTAEINSRSRAPTASIHVRTCHIVQKLPQSSDLQVPHPSGQTEDSATIPLSITRVRFSQKTGKAWTKNQNQSSHFQPV